MRGLRFDKVAKRFVADVRRELRELVPDGKTLVVTITAPIRERSKTALELVEKLRRRLSRRPTKMDIDEVIHGNRIRGRLMSGASKSKVIGYVHNTDVDAEALFRLARPSGGRRARESS